MAPVVVWGGGSQILSLLSVMEETCLTYLVGCLLRSSTTQTVSFVSVVTQMFCICSTVQLSLSLKGWEWTLTGDQLESLVYSALTLDSRGRGTMALV